MSAPKRAAISSMRVRPRPTLASSARKSAWAADGQREFRRKIRSAPSFTAPWSASFVGGTMMPS
jgi:hypothetical protein